MPRRHRSARERHPSARPSPTWLPPLWAERDGYVVRQQVRADRDYVCPGCNQAIRPGMSNVVAWPEEEEDLRRHWHVECWRRELRSL